MVETKQYAWKDIRVRVLGRDFLGIREIKYKRTSDDEHLHGRGNKAISIQTGNETCDGSFMLLQSEMIALTNAVAQQLGVNLLDIRFDIVVTYKANDIADVTTDIIQGVKITEYEKGMAQGDKFMEIDCPFLAMDIIDNVA